MASRLTALLASVEKLLAAGPVSAAKADDYKAKYPELAAGIDEVVEADPTSQKKYLDWSVGQLRKGADASELAEAIKEYHAAVPRLQGQDRELHSLKSIEDMKAAVSRAAQVVTRGDKRHKSKKGGVILYEKGNWKLVHPITMDGSIYWGSNTSWCVSRRDKKENYFYKYVGDGNVQFYFLINEDAETYTEEVAYRHVGPHFSKLAILFSDGKQLKREPFQDAANRHPAEHVVQDKLGPDFFKEVMGIARKHAEKHKTTWAYEILHTDDPTTFQKLYEENSSETSYLNSTALMRQSIRLGKPEERLKALKIIEEIVSKSNEHDELATMTLVDLMGDEATGKDILVLIARLSTNRVVLQSLVARADFFKYPEVIEEAISKVAKEQILLSDHCPTDLFLRVIESIPKPPLYNIINWRRNLGERELLWIVEKNRSYGGKYYGQSGIGEGLDLAHNMLKTTESLPHSVAVKMLSYGTESNKQEVAGVLARSGQIQRETMEMLSENPEVYEALSGNSNTPASVLKKVFEKASREGVPIFAPKMAANPSAPLDVLSRLLDMAKEVNFGDRIARSALSNPKLPLDLAKKAMDSLIDDFVDEDYKDSLYRLLTENVTPSVQKWLIDSGYAIRVANTIIGMYDLSEPPPEVKAGVAEVVDYLLLGLLKPIAEGEERIRDSMLTAAYRIMDFHIELKKLTLEKLKEDVNWPEYGEDYDYRHEPVVIQDRANDILNSIRADKLL